MSLPKVSTNSVDNKVGDEKTKQNKKLDNVEHLHTQQERRSKAGLLVAGLGPKVSWPGLYCSVSSVSYSLCGEQQH